MATFCIRKEKIVKLKEAFKRISGENKLGKLLEMDSEKRIAFFEKITNKEEAQLLSRELDRAVASERASALKNWVKNNLDEVYREKKISSAQKMSIKGFIERKLFPGKKISEIVKIDEILKMKSDKQLSFLKTILPEEDAIKAHQKIQNISQTALDKEISDKIALVASGELKLKDFYKFIDRKADYIAALKEGTTLSTEETGRIVALSKKMSESKKFFDEESGTWKNEEAAKMFGVQHQIYNKYIDSLKNPKKSTMQSLKAWYQTTKSRYKKDVFTATGETAVDILKTISDNMVSAAGSWDNSFAGRQGWNTLMTHPSAWAPSAKKSVASFLKTLFGKKGTEENIKDLMMSDIYSRDNFSNGLYKEAGIMDLIEESFPTSLPGRLPFGVGRVFRASEVAFGQGLRMRVDLFDLLTKNFNTKTGKSLELFNSASIKEAEREEMKKILKDIGKITMSSTGRGKFGKIGESEIVKLALWAPRLLKSSWDNLTAHSLGLGLETNLARKEAFIGLAKHATVLLGAMKMIEGLGAEVEWDTNSSNFGAVKVGDTWIKLGGAELPLFVLASRLKSGITKSGKTGIETEVGKEFGSADRVDLIINFLRGKAAPPVGTAWDLISGKTMTGEKATITDEAFNRFIPISVQNAFDAKNPSAWAGVVADFFGKSQTTYDVIESNWEEKETKEMKQFVDKFGKDETKKASKDYSNETDKRINSTVNSKEYKEMSNEEKKKEIARIRKEVKQEIFDKYNFVYERE